MERRLGFDPGRPDRAVTGQLGPFAPRWRATAVKL